MTGLTAPGGEATQSRMPRLRHEYYLRLIAALREEDMGLGGAEAPLLAVEARGAAAGELLLAGLLAPCSPRTLGAQQNIATAAAAAWEEGHLREVETVAVLEPTAAEEDEEEEEEERKRAFAAAAALPQGGDAPPSPCGFLVLGQQFAGQQCVTHAGSQKSEHWEVRTTIQGYDSSTGYVCGTMEAANVPEAAEPVTTFFEGQVVDNANHTFFTADWEACGETDLRHWSRLDGFACLRREVLRRGGRSSALASHPYIYMRWKERFFVRGHKTRLTIAGFYYLALCRASGEVSGFYWDPSSSPDQRLDLQACPAGDAGHAFAAHELA